MTIIWRSRGITSNWPRKKNCFPWRGDVGKLAKRFSTRHLTTFGGQMPCGLLAVLRRQMPLDQRPHVGARRERRDAVDREWTGQRSGISGRNQKIGSRCHKKNPSGRMLGVQSRCLVTCRLLRLDGRGVGGWGCRPVSPYDLYNFQNRSSVA